MRPLFRNLFLSALLVLTGCSITPPHLFQDPEADHAPDRQLDPDAIADAVPRNEPRSKSGNPDSYVVFGKRYHVLPSSRGFHERGIASWYGTKFHGRKTSSGEPYDMYQMTAAHKTLPLPTYVEVVNLKNHRRIIVKVNDRGPFHANRIIDLSYAAATKLGILGNGTGLVEIHVVQPGEHPMLASKPPRDEHASKNPLIFLQIGAFSNRINADHLGAKLHRLLDQPLRIQQVQLRENTMYRVQIGPLATVDLVDNLTTRLDTLGIKESHVVIE